MYALFEQSCERFASSLHVQKTASLDVITESFSAVHSRAVRGGVHSSVSSDGAPCASLRDQGNP